MVDSENDLSEVGWLVKAMWPKMARLAPKRIEWKGRKQKKDSKSVDVKQKVVCTVALALAVEGNILWIGIWSVDSLLLFVRRACVGGWRRRHLELNTGIRLGSAHSGIVSLTGVVATHSKHIMLASQWKESDIITSWLPCVGRVCVCVLHSPLAAAAARSAQRREVSAQLLNTFKARLCAYSQGGSNSGHSVCVCGRMRARTHSPLPPLQVQRAPTVGGDYFHITELHLWIFRNEIFQFSRVSICDFFVTSEQSFSLCFRSISVNRVNLLRWLNLYYLQE